MKRPLISVITVVFNSQSTLEATIRSVISQEKGLYEYLIIDGGSTDGSLDVIYKYQENITRWVSESDSGIYDAMNKGIEIANGKWIYFLGADDRLEPGVLSKVSKHIDEKFVLIYGDVKFENGRTVPSFINIRTIMQNTIHHQGAFYSKNLFSKFRYNTDYKIMSDYELNLKIFLDKLPIHKVPFIIAECNQGGASSKIDTSILETNKIRSKYLNLIENLIADAMLNLYYFQKKIRNLIK